ncbi:MAG: GTPase HflX [Acidobacteriota bacterium]
MLTRDGRIRDVIVGDASQVEIPEIGRLRSRPGRLRGLRLVHTHLKGEPLSMDDLNDLALLRLDAVVVLHAKEDGSAGKIEVAHVIPPSPDGEESEPFHFYEAPNPASLNLDFGAAVNAVEDEFSILIKAAVSDTGQERALIIGVSPDEFQFSETVDLAVSAGALIAGTVRQKRNQLHPKTIVGKGKLVDIVLEGMRRQAELAIFDVDLKPAQARIFEDSTGLKVVDRTQLILDIFAQRAASRDGKIMVELAQLKYSLPRLSEKESRLSRHTGGIGTRGPGETTMEIGRRRISDRVRKLEKQVAGISKQRSLRRVNRRRHSVPVVALVGYTNAGKTSLLNVITKSEVRVEDKLFVTLDPTTRRVRFPGDQDVLLTDTVGFIRDLPADLVTAFKATLEEAGEADLLLHVADIGDEQLEMKIDSVNRILTDLEMNELPRLLVLNKSDLVGPLETANLCKRYNGIPVTTLDKKELPGFLDLVGKELRQIAGGQKLEPEK